MAAGLMLTTYAANAQQKIGSIDTHAVFESLSEAKTASTTIETLINTRKAEYEKLMGQYQAKEKAVLDKEKTLSEANKEVVTKELIAAQTELQGLYKKIKELETKTSQDVATKQNELIPPLQKKVKEAISAVAKEKNLSFVFDISMSDTNLVYTDGSEDITIPVKARLHTSATPPKSQSKG